MSYIKKNISNGVQICALFQVVNCYAFMPCSITLSKIEGSEKYSEAGRLLNAANPKYHKGHLVERVVEEWEKGKGKKIIEPAKRVSTWLEYLEKTADSDRAIEMVKQAFIEEYVLTEKDVPQSYYKLQIQISRERGAGTINLSDEHKQRLAQIIIIDQKNSLSQWLDYLFSKDTESFPMWTKAWVLSGLTKLGKFNQEEGIFQKRTKSTINPFPELNREALALTMEEIEHTSLPIPSFEKIYIKHLLSFAKMTQNLSKTNGQWVKYERGSSSDSLVKSLQSKNTGWCTAARQTAITQLKGGDLYVYYSNDNQGQPSIPRLAIRMEGSKIREVRGIAHAQNFDSEILKTQILDLKLKEFGKEGVRYRKRSSDMRKLSEIEKKNKLNEAFSDDDIRFLYELDVKIDGFGYGEDPRIAEILNTRSYKKDLSQVTGFREDEISNDIQDVLQGRDIKFFFGNLNFPDRTSAQGLKMPKIVAGSVELGGLISAKDLKLPESIEGSLKLDGLTTAKGLKLPNSIGETLFLAGLKSAEGLELPSWIGGTLSLSALLSAKGLKFPSSLRGILILDGLTSANGLELSESFEGHLNLNGLISTHGLKLPISIEGSLYLDGLTSVEGLKLPESIQGALSLKGLKSAHGLKLPNTLGNSIFLNNLTTLDGVDLPSNFIGAVYLKEKIITYK